METARAITVETPLGLLEIAQAALGWGHSRILDRFNGLNPQNLFPGCEGDPPYGWDLDERSAAPRLLSAPSRHS